MVVFDGWDIGEMEDYLDMESISIGQSTLVGFRALAGLDCYDCHTANLDCLLCWCHQPSPWQEARFTTREWAIKHGFQVNDPDDGRSAA